MLCLTMLAIFTVVESLFSDGKISSPNFTMFCFKWTLDIVSQQLIYVCLIMFMCYSRKVYWVTLGEH